MFDLPSVRELLINLAWGLGTIFVIGMILRVWQSRFVK
jgi:hypothetical protein